MKLQRRNAAAIIAALCLVVFVFTTYKSFHDYKRSKLGKTLVKEAEALTQDDTSEPDWYLHNFDCVLMVETDVHANIM